MMDSDENYSKISCTACNVSVFILLCYILHNEWYVDNGNWSKSMIMKNCVTGQVSSTFRLKQSKPIETFHNCFYVEKLTLKVLTVLGPGAVNYLRLKRLFLNLGFKVILKFFFNLL